MVSDGGGANDAVDSAVSFRSRGWARVCGERKQEAKERERDGVILPPPRRGRGEEERTGGQIPKGMPKGSRETARRDGKGKKEREISCL